MVTVLFGYNDGLDFMAGGSYRLAAVQVAATFEGEADYPTITRNDVTIDKLWFSRSGTVFFGSAVLQDVGHASPVVDALRTLPIVELDRALHFRGSAMLRYDLSRRLR